MTLPLLDAGSVAALLVAADRGIARWAMLRTPKPPPAIPIAWHGDPGCPGHTIGLPAPGCLTATATLEKPMSEPEPNQTPETPVTDPYAGARAMGVTVPAPAPEAPAPADDTSDYDAYLAWKASQKPASVPADVASPFATPGITVTPEAATPVGAYLGADVTAAENTAEAVAPGLVARLKSIISDHQALIDELSQVVGDLKL